MITVDIQSKIKHYSIYFIKSPTDTGAQGWITKLLKRTQTEPELTLNGKVSVSCSASRTTVTYRCFGITSDRVNWWQLAKCMAASGR